MGPRLVTCPLCGSIVPMEIIKWILPEEKAEEASLMGLQEGDPKCQEGDPKCPMCGGLKPWKDGVRYLPSGELQRYLCRHCGYRFSRW